MPPLLFPAPSIIDQSGATSQAELQSAAVALGQLDQGLQADEFRILVSDVVEQFVRNFWDFAPDVAWDSSLVHDIYTFLTVLFDRSPDNTVLHIDLEVVDNFSRHPLPEDCGGRDLAELWQDDAGKLKALHDAIVGETGCALVGVACAQGFSGEVPQPRYVQGETEAHLPLVTRETVSNLANAFRDLVRGDQVQAQVSYRAFRRNVALLGGNRTGRTVGSHEQYSFSGNRTWPLDTGYEAVSDDHLRGLARNLGLSFQYVKYVLLVGEVPDEVCLLMQ